MRCIGWWVAALAVASTACQGSGADDTGMKEVGGGPTIAQKLAQYTPFRLTADLSA
jgi:hypothetical protein